MFPSSACCSLFYLPRKGQKTHNPHFNCRFWFQKGWITQFAAHTCHRDMYGVYGNGRVLCVEQYALTFWLYPHQFSNGISKPWLSVFGTFDDRRTPRFLRGVCPQRSPFPRIQGQRFQGGGCVRTVVCAYAPKHTSNRLHLL